MKSHYSKLALAGLALMTCAAPQAHSQTSTCYGMYVIDVYHCSVPLVKLIKDPKNSGNPITAYVCTGVKTKYDGPKKYRTFMTRYAPIPIVPTSPDNGGLTPANPDPRSTMLADGKVIYDPTKTNRYAEKGAIRLKTSIEASICHKEVSAKWRGKVSPLCGYTLPLSAYEKAGMWQNTFDFPGAEANDFAVIIGSNTIWKDDTHPQVQTFCGPAASP